MKKNRLLPSFRRNLRRLMMPVAMCSVALMAASCSKATDDDGTTLPEGMYPIEFTATGLQATLLTRTTVDGTWDGSEQIAIKIENDVKKYVIDDANKDKVPLKAASEMFYYQTRSPFLASAWYCGTGYDSVRPTEWTVETNQNTEKNYQKSDFLYAYDTFGFMWGNSSLHFFHQTAKVTVHILSGDHTPADVTADKIVSLTIGDSDNMSLKGGWAAPTDEWKDEKSNVYGSWSASSATKGVITAQSFGEQSITLDGGGKTLSLASYQALVIPQTIDANSRLFKIYIKGYSQFYYIVPAGGIEWKAGTEHIYYITIEGTKLSVTTSESIGWDTDGASSSGSVTFIGDKFAENAAVGDFYMSDGTLVDNKADFLTDKQKTACIGIGYCVDKTFIKDKSTKKSQYPHGLVVALKDAGSCNWDGITKAVNDYKKSTVTSNNSSGWYCPNDNELKYICRGTNYDSPTINGAKLLNTQYKKLESYADQFTQQEQSNNESTSYWTSTEYNGDKAYNVFFDKGYVNNNNKTNTFRVRCILAF